MSILQDWSQVTRTATPIGAIPAPFAAQPLNPANDVEFVRPAHGAAKRALDLCIAIPLLIILAPLLLLVAVAVRLETQGPAIFRQTRLGAGGKPFTIYKFRSMSVTENGARIDQARRNDPRVTRLGRVLRMTSIDELPQLFNVLEGDMSLVGPRPHARAHDEHYARLIPHYTLRQRVKPGITGWAQVNGMRGETPTLESMRARVDLDAWYVAHADVLLDLKILWRTTFALLRARNAY